MAAPASRELTVSPAAAVAAAAAAAATTLLPLLLGGSDDDLAEAEASLKLLSASRRRLSDSSDFSFACLKYHSDTITESGHTAAFSSLSRSSSAIHNRKALHSPTFCSFPHRLGLHSKHEKTSTRSFDTNERRLSTEHDLLILSIQ